MYFESLDMNLSLDSDTIHYKSKHFQYLSTYTVSHRGQGQTQTTSQCQRAFGIRQKVVKQKMGVLKRKHQAYKTK